MDICDDISVEIENILKQLSSEHKIQSIPKWTWTKTLLTFSDISNNKILLDQIYVHIWKDTAQRISIRTLIFYEIAFCFYYLTKNKSIIKEKEIPPLGKGARNYAKEKTGLSPEDYTNMLHDILANIGEKLTDYLINF
jgi:hypothetical protein